VAASGVYTVNKINSIEEEKNSKETPVSSSVQSVARDTKEEAEVASMETSEGLVTNQKQVSSTRQVEKMEKEASSLISDMSEEIEDKEETINDIKNDGMTEVRKAKRENFGYLNKIAN